MRNTKAQKQKLVQALLAGLPVSRALAESGYTRARQAKKCKVAGDVSENASAEGATVDGNGQATDSR